MFIIEWWAALVSFLAVAAFYIYVKQRKPEINWGSSTQAHIYRRSLEYSLKLTNTEEHVKNFRPNFLVLTGPPNTRPALSDFIAEMTKNTSLMVCANIKLTTDLNDPDNLTDAYEWINKRRIKSFFTEINSTSLRAGAISLMQATGIGKLRPNTLAMGFKSNWQTDQWQTVLDYYEIINDAFQMNFGLCLLKLDGGLDYSNLLGDELSQECSLLIDAHSSDSSSDEIEIRETLIDNHSNQTDFKIATETIITNQNRTKWTTSKSSQLLINTKMDSSLSKMPSSEERSILSADDNNNFIRKNFKSDQVIKLKNSKINQGVLQGLNYFHKKYHNGFVDVWWLFDDGGLTILLPYLIMQRKYWNKCKLRIFIQTKNERVDISEEQRNMATLLSKFRIKFHELIVFTTLDKKPDPSK